MSGPIAELYASIGIDVSGLQKGFATAKTWITSHKDLFVGSLALMAGADEKFNAAFEKGWTRVAGAASAATGVLTGDYEKMGAVLGALPGPIGVVGSAIGETMGRATAEFVSTTEAMRKLSLQTGAGVEFLSTFREGAKDMRVNVDAMDQSLRIFAKNLGGINDADTLAATGGKGLTAVFKEQGITVGSYEQTLFNLADRIQALGPSEESSRLATQAFGRAGQELIPVLLKGSEGIRQLMKDNKDLAITMADVKGVNTLKAAEDALDDRNLVLSRNISHATVPALLSMSTVLNTVLTDFRYLGDAAGLQIEVQRQLTETVTKAKLAEGEQADKVKELADAHTTLITEANSSTAAQAKLAAVMDITGREYQDNTEYAHGLADRQTELAGIIDRSSGSFARLQAGTAANIPTFTEFGSATQALVERQQELDKVTAEVATKQADLAQKLGLVTGAISDFGGKLTKIQEAQTAFKLATGQTTVAQVETELATKALTKAYVDGKIGLDQFVKSSKDLATGNTAEPFFALQKAGGKANVEVVGVVKQLRDVEKAAGVADKSTLSYADSLKIVTTSYQKTTAGTQTAQDALTKYTATQITNSAAVADAKKQYDQHKISLDQYAATKAGAITSDQNAKAALDAVKKAAGGAGEATVTYSRVVDTAKGSADNLGAAVKADEDIFNKSTTAVQNFGTAVSRIPDAGPSVLPSEVTMHAFDTTANRTAAGEIPAGIAQGVLGNQQVAIGAMTGMATAMQDAFTASWGIKSPSTVAAGFSNDIDAGFASGITGGLGQVTTSFTGISDAFSLMVSGMVTTISDPTPWAGAGVLIDTTLAQSIRDNAGAVTAALKDIIANAIAAATGGIGYGAGKGRALGAP
jgi:hypothetical protein